MREETRPILSSVLGWIAGAGPVYWATVAVLSLWHATPSSGFVQGLVGPQTTVTGALIGELRTWFVAVLVIEALVILSALLLLFFPRRHIILGVLLLGLSAIGLGLMDYFPFGIGRTELLDGMAFCPVVGILAGITGLVFRSDLEFARAYGFD